LFVLFVEYCDGEFIVSIMPNVQHGIEGGLCSCLIVVVLIDVLGEAKLPMLGLKLHHGKSEVVVVAG